jgi:hypothetical protein
VQQSPSSFRAIISKALRASFNDVANEPLPQRWIDLIHHLNEQERVDTDGHPRDGPSRFRRPPSH